MDRAAFFAAIRAPLFGGHMTQPQVDGMVRILDYMDAKPVRDVRWQAYMLATVLHETGATLQPVTEQGGDAYLRAKPYWPFVGRGLVQITWRRNYATFGKRLGIDLIGNPDMALTWDVALPVLVIGMSLGLFTGVGLPRYFGARVDDPVQARRIVNGMDRAQLVASYHRTFLAALTEAPVAMQPQQLHARPVPVVDDQQGAADRLNQQQLDALHGG